MMCLKCRRFVYNHCKTQSILRKMQNLSWDVGNPGVGELCNWLRMTPIIVFIFADRQASHNKAVENVREWTVTLYRPPSLSAVVPLYHVMAGVGSAVRRTSNTTPLPTCLMVGFAVNLGAEPDGPLDTETQTRTTQSLMKLCTLKHKHT